MCTFQSREWRWPFPADWEEVGSPETHRRFLTQKAYKEELLLSDAHAHNEQCTVRQEIKFSRLTRRLIFYLVRSRKFVCIWALYCAKNVHVLRREREIEMIKKQRGELGHDSPQWPAINCQSRCSLFWRDIRVRNHTLPHTVIMFSWTASARPSLTWSVSNTAIYVESTVVCFTSSCNATSAADAFHQSKARAHPRHSRTPKLGSGHTHIQREHTYTRFSVVSVSIPVPGFLLWRIVTSSSLSWR